MIGETRTDIEVCVDCIMLIANGEVFDGEGNDIADEHAAKIDAIWGDAHIAYGGEDRGFSWSRCDGCDSVLGGDRFAAVAFTSDESVTPAPIGPRHALGFKCDCGECPNTSNSTAKG